MISSLVSDDVKELLQAHGIIGTGPDSLAAIPNNNVFDTLDEALQFCEHQFIQDAGVFPRILRGREERLEDLLTELVAGLPGKKYGEQSVQDLARHFSRKEILAGASLFGRADQPKSITIIAAGTLRVSQSLADAANTRASSAREEPPRIDGVGTILGDAAFYGGEPHGCDAVAGSDGCVVYCLECSSIDDLEESEPKTMNLLHKMLLRDNVRFRQQFLVPKAVGL